ncbi:MAG: glycosyltransferase [Bryobacteraceae bacterium]
MTAASSYVLLCIACVPFFYYLLALYSSWRFFRRRPDQHQTSTSFTPPVSILKPVRGRDSDAYENFASFCQQDYPIYEIVFCLGSSEDEVVGVLEKLKQDFPQIQIRILFGSLRVATNDKVAKLARLSEEAKYEHLVISDSDVRVRPDYLRNVVAPLADVSVGAVTCLYVSTGDKTRVDKLQTVGMVSDFYPGLFVARELEGVKFALGPSIATTRTHLNQFGGYEKIKNQPADDLLVGRFIAEQGYQVELSPYSIQTVADYQSLGELVHKRMRWLVVMRHMRPKGHFGLLFTQGLPWLVVALAAHPTRIVTFALVLTYLALRLATLWLVGVWGLKRALWKSMPLVVVWDLLAFCLWTASFVRNTVRWRGGDYYIRDGNLVPVTTR